MLIVTAEKYRHFTPKAPELSFNIPSLAADGSTTLMYQYLIREPSEQIRKELPRAFWSMPEDFFSVYVDGILQKKNMLFLKVETWSEHAEPALSYEKQGAFLYTYYKYIRSFLHQIPGNLPNYYDVAEPIALGSTVLIKSTETFDGWYHLDIRRLLIQGANPLDYAVLGTHDNFQGGYRLEYFELDNVKYGQLRRCDSHLGWDYKPPPGYHGIDSFSYRLATEFGQVSEPACCSIRVGY